MYYHCRPIEFVRYGRVFPPPRSAIDPLLLQLYDWLGQYIGYSPQVWLSRSKSHYTGYRQKRFKGKQAELALFGFKCIKGTPVSMKPWEWLFGPIWSSSGKEIFGELREHAHSIIADREGGEFESLAWSLLKADSPKTWLRDVLFMKNDQVVVPSLNLKAANEVFVRNERQKRRLRRHGFIEDRIVIRNQIYRW